MPKRKRKFKRIAKYDDNAKQISAILFGFGFMMVMGYYLAYLNSIGGLIISAGLLIFIALLFLFTSREVYLEEIK